MVDVPLVSIAFKHEELQALIRVLRNELRAAFLIKNYQWADTIRSLLQKLGDDTDTV